MERNSRVDEVTQGIDIWLGEVSRFHMGGLDVHRRFFEELDVADFRVEHSMRSDRVDSGRMLSSSFSTYGLSLLRLVNFSGSPLCLDEVEKVGLVGRVSENGLRGLGEIKYGGIANQTSRFIKVGFKDETFDLSPKKLKQDTGWQNMLYSRLAMCVYDQDCSATNPLDALVPNPGTAIRTYDIQHLKIGSLLIDLG